MRRLAWVPILILLHSCEYKCENLIGEDGKIQVFPQANECLKRVQDDNKIKYPQYPMGEAW